MKLPVNKIICGDCLEVMKDWPDNCIDLVVTSPPYNIGINYDIYEDTIPYEDWLDWLNKIWDECLRIIIEGGRICINCNDTGRNPYYPSHCDIASRIRKKWYMMGIIVWDKMSSLSNTAWGSWKSPSAPSLRGRQEYIIIAGKGGKVLQKENGIIDEYGNREFLSLTSEIWSLIPQTNNKLHPVPFPIELPKRLIKLYSYRNAIILDPFVGSGTTCVSAKILGRDYIGIDISKKYCDISKQRLKGVRPSLFERPKKRTKIERASFGLSIKKCKRRLKYDSK